MTEGCILTPRLKLRPFKQSDLEALLAYRNNPEVSRYQGWGSSYSSAQASEFIAEMSVREPGNVGWTQIAIELQSTGATIGDVAINTLEFEPRTAMIGYTLSREKWGQGYAIEAVNAVLKYCFEDLKMHRIRANCDTRNSASWRMLEKLGFRREAHFIESYPELDTWCDEFEYALLEREWFGLQAI
jgi:RimJ/RimL family protein N-acetyltransferase